jgi:hypothetical protein
VGIARHLPELSQFSYAHESEQQQQQQLLIRGHLLWLLGLAFHTWYGWLVLVHRGQPVSRALQ